MKATPDDAETDDDPRLLAAVQEYLAILESGRRPDRRAVVERYPDLNEALTPYLDALDAVHHAAPILHQDSTLPGNAVSENPLPAEPLGDFRIIREVGRGGMGVVYEAIQLSLGRRVAVKVLPFAATLDARQLQRFKMEAQAAAQLHHTNIVPVYAVGCERGLHFYAMQLIDGRPLDQVIRELREAARPGGETPEAQETLAAGRTPTRPVSPASGPRSLSASLLHSRADFFRTVARMIVQAADALEFAHQAGVVHRDVKPGNLLLDGKGNVWVTDFGLAQVSADVGLTRTGDLLGTLRYMSPEQAAGRNLQIDHRSDVYSLGATLYELLTLEPVFAGQDRQSLLQQILNDDPCTLRKLDRTIPIELDTIVLKALAKLPADRYASAGDLAADLRRFLDERPILARRPSLLDRCRKWMRRHPTPVRAAGVLLVCGFVGLGVSTALIAREQKRTREALARELRRAEEAESRFQLARRSADEMIRIADEELMDNPGQQTLRRRLLEAALAYYQEFIEQRRDDPSAQAELQATRDRVKTILSDLAVMQGAWQHVLLREPSVQDDLKLSAEQRDRLNEILHPISEPKFEPFEGFHRLSKEQRSQRILEEVKAKEAAIATVVSSEQLRRLRQIALQVRGTMVFQEPDVVSALKLTAAQREQLRSTEFAIFFGPIEGGMIRGSGPPPPRMSGPRFDQEFNIKPMMDKMLANLTPLQKQKWDEMVGAPFTGRVGTMIRFGPGPGRPR